MWRGRHGTTQATRLRAGGGLRFASAIPIKARRYYNGVLGFAEAFTIKDAAGRVASVFFKVNDDQFVEVLRPTGRHRPEPPAGVRHVPVEGIVLTDAELDHTLGIALLREARRLRLAATDAVRRVIEDDSRILTVTRAFADVSVDELVPDRPLGLCYGDGTSSGLRVTCFPVPAGPPRFASEERQGHTVGVVVREEATGRSCAFVPGCGALDDGLTARLAAADLVLFDGTFWTDDELIGLGIGERTARQMDHLPIIGTGREPRAAAATPGPRTGYTRTSTTPTPCCSRTRPSGRAVEAAGLRIGADGMRFTL